MPKTIHMQVTRHDIKDIPTQDDKVISAWCIEKWQEKENVLKEFYKNKSFTSSHYIESDYPAFLHYGIILYWAIFTFFCFWAIYSYSLVRWYLLLVSVFYYVQTKFYGGTERFEMSFVK
jgi:hypothetical protein